MREGNVYTLASAFLDAFNTNPIGPIISGLQLGHQGDDTWSPVRLSSECRARMDVIHEILEEATEPIEKQLLEEQEQLEVEIASPNASSPKSPTGTGASTDEPVFSMNVADYQLGSVIGFGSSAIVHMATFLPLDLQVAIKMIELDHFDRHRIDELRKEIQVMTFCKHPNLLGIHTSFVHESKLWIVTPFLAGGSCLDLMKTGFKTGFEEAAIATILIQALQGLQYLHEHGHIHRDVKCGNLLMAEDGLVQLADFGVSASLAEEGGERKGVRKTYVGTPCWMAPEVMEFTRGYDFKADIWSFGITALELAYGHAPYAKFPPMKVIYLTLSGNPPTLDKKQCARKYSRAFKDMIDCCLQRDPNRRPTARALLKHPFFKSAAKKPAYLQESVLNRVPSVDLRDKSAQLKARGYVAVSGTGATEGNFAGGEDNAEEGEASVLSAEESWDFSLDSATAIPEEDEEFVEENENEKEKENVFDTTVETAETVETAIDPIIESSIDASTSSSSNTTTTSTTASSSNATSMVSPSLKQSRFIVDDDDDNEVALAEADDSDKGEQDGVDEEGNSLEAGNRSTSPSSGGTQADNPSQSHHPTEVKKGRFSVLEAVDSADEHPSSDAESDNLSGNEGAAAAVEEAGSRFEVQASDESTTMTGNDAFKGFSGISRPPSAHLSTNSHPSYHPALPSYHHHHHPASFINYGYAHPSAVYANLPPPPPPQHQQQQQMHHALTHQPPSQNHQQLDSLLQMNEYIRSQLLELKHQQEWLAMRTHATINPVSSVSSPPQPHPQSHHPFQMLPTSHSHPNLYMAQGGISYHPSISSPPAAAATATHGTLHHPAYYAPPPSAIHHLPVSPVYPFPPSSTVEASTPVTSLADSSSSLALNNILRELEAVRRENEALKVTIHKQQNHQQ